MKKVNSITEQINAETREVRVTINSQWCSQVQATPGIAADVLLIGMKIKGEGSGGVEPTDVNKMFNWGIVERDNFQYTFDPADADKAVYYMAGYISGKTKK